MAILWTFKILIISCAICFVQSSKYPHISDCVYEAGQYIGQSNLTLICTKDIHENDLLRPYLTSQCRNQKNEFHKFMVGVLNFKNCELSEVPANLFQAYEDIHTLNMPNLNVESLNVDTFHAAAVLRNLFAAHNKINEIPANLFNKSKEIRTLDLSFNRINHFDPKAFPIFNQLQELNLSSNNITELAVNLFQRLYNLKHLHLAHNQIGEIPSFLFHKTVQLNEIDFSFNRIRVIDDFAFAGDMKLTKLNLSHNQIATLHRKLVENVPHLTHFDVSSNQISALQFDTFQNLRQLKHFDLSDNPIKTIDTKLFANLVALQNLNLSRTLLMEIEPKTFGACSAIEILDLSSNALKSLNVTILPSPPKHLELLLIGNNQLQELNGFSNETIPGAKIHGIDSNRLNCSYLERLFQSITWKQIGLISERINCSSTNEIAASIDEVESTTLLADTSDIDETSQSYSTSSEQPETTLVNFCSTHTRSESPSPFNENENSKQVLNHKEYANLNALPMYFFMLVVVMIVGFITIGLVFICLIVRVGVLNRELSQTIQTTDRLKSAHSIETVIDNSVANHLYEVVKCK